jgi:hypothetical protein
MTREESWQAQGETLAILRHVAAAGYVVSVFRFPSSLFGTRPAAVDRPVGVCDAVQGRGTDPQKAIKAVEQIATSCLRETRTAGCRRCSSRP